MITSLDEVNAIMTMFSMVFIILTERDTFQALYTGKLSLIH